MHSARPGAERHVVASPAPRPEPAPVPVPVPVNRSGSKRSGSGQVGRPPVQQPRAEEDQRPRRDRDPVDDVVLQRAPADHPGRRVEPQRLVDGRPGVRQGGQVGPAEPGPLGERRSAASRSWTTGARRAASRLQVRQDATVSWPAMTRVTSSSRTSRSSSPPVDAVGRAQQQREHVGVRVRRARRPGGGATTAGHASSRVRTTARRSRRCEGVGSQPGRTAGNGERARRTTTCERGVDGLDEPLAGVRESRRRTGPSRPPRSSRAAWPGRRPEIPAASHARAGVAPAIAAAVATARGGRGGRRAGRSGGGAATASPSAVSRPAPVTRPRAAYCTVRLP